MIIMFLYLYKKVKSTLFSSHSVLRLFDNKFNLKPEEEGKTSPEQADLFLPSRLLATCQADRPTAYR